MKKKIFLLLLVIIVTAQFMPLIASAAVSLDPNLRPGYAVNLPISGNGGVQDSANVGNIIMQMIAGSLIYAAGPIAVLMLVIGGFRYVISHGDQTQMENAKKTITYAIIGLLVIIVSYAIVRNVINVVRETSPTATSTTTGAPASTGPQGGTLTNGPTANESTPTAPPNQGGTASGTPADEQTPDAS